MFENFISNIKNGFKVANATRKLVFSDKELFLYPIVSAIIGIAFAVLVIGIGAALLLTGAFAGMSGGQIVLIAVLLLILLYFLVYFVSTYFTIAMLIAFRSYASGSKGKKIGMAEALGLTAPYTVLIIKWSIFYTIIVTIITIIAEAIRIALARFGIIGNIISGVLTGGINLALAASIAFAFPIILDEKKGPIATLKSSISFIMKNFGDTFGGLLFAEIFQIVFLLIGLGMIFLGILLYSVAVLAIALVAIGLIVIVAGVLLRYVLFNCFKLIIYDYKTRGTLPKGFDKNLIDSSIKRKKNQNGSKPLSPFGVGTGGGNI
jgi:MFS family permease